MQIAMADALHVEPELLVEDGIDFAVSVSTQTFSGIDLEIRIAQLKLVAEYEIESIKALEANGMRGASVERFGIYEGRTLVVDDFDTRFEADNYLREITMHVDETNGIVTNRARKRTTYHVRRTYFKPADHCITSHACKFRDAMASIKRTRGLLTTLKAA
jgi:hypothetical protein